MFWLFSWFIIFTYPIINNVTIEIAPRDERNQPNEHEFSRRYGAHLALIRLVLFFLNELGALKGECCNLYSLALY
jgi:hypothetical protein